MRSIKILATIAILTFLSGAANAQTTQQPAASKDAAPGINDIIAIISTQNNNISCKKINNAIKGIIKKQNINENDIHTIKTNDCTIYFYEKSYLGKSCCLNDPSTAITTNSTEVSSEAINNFFLISPDSGDIGGSDNVTIYGSNFDKHVRVAFDGIPATNVTSYGESLSVSVPAHAAGTVNVTITDQCGVTKTFTKGYTYTPQPVITSITPTSGHVGGSKNLTIYGNNFSYHASRPTVTIGGKNATNVSVYGGGDAISFDVPAHAEGTVNVVVTNTSGASATLSNGYTYSSTPTVTYQSNSSGHTGGTENLLLMGRNFSQNSGLPTVTFGGASGTNITLYSGGSSLIVDTPAHAKETVSFTVTNSDGKSVTKSNAYTYSAIPTISSLSVASGDTHGSQNLTINGTNFSSKAGTPSVIIGGTPATSVTSYGSALTVDPGNHATGTVDITVTNPGGESVTKTNCYTYSAQPTISFISPTSGSANGTDNVSLYGTNYSYYPHVPSVTFGGVPGTNVRVYGNGSSIMVDAPAHVAGDVPIVVTNSSGASASYSSYTYLGNLCPMPTIFPSLLPLLKK